MCLHRHGMVRLVRVSLNSLDQGCGKLSNFVPKLRIYPALKILIYRMTLIDWVFQHPSGDWWMNLIFLCFEQEMK